MIGDRLLTAFLAATIGNGCNSASEHAVAPTEPSRDRAHAGDHGNHGTGMHHGFANASEWSHVLDDPERDTWQHPEEVVRTLELSPTMTVADVGAGTGYFAVKLARAVPAGSVIATDIEPDMVRYLEERARRDRLPNLRATLATRTTSGLTPQSVDRILVVNVWHHLADRADYARDLAAALRPGGKLVIVDFGLAARRGPPMELRVKPEAIIADLAAAGLVAKVSPVVLPEQYIVEARREH